MDSSKLVDRTDVESFIDKLSESCKEYLAIKILGDLPVERKAKLLEKQLSNSGLVVVVSGCNLYSQILNVPNTDLAAVIEAVVVARRQN
jgi:hypothetical protein